MTDPGPVAGPGTRREPRARDRSFGPALVAGLGGAALASVAGSRTWATGRGDAAGLRVEEAVAGADVQPLVASLALVALAAWGVLLVVRGRARRGVAGVGLVAAVGSLTAWLVALGGVRDEAVAAVVARGSAADAVDTATSGWLYLAGVGAVLAAAALMVAVIRSPSWPAMGSRYDAPAVREPVKDEDMWRALDEGRDPTS